MISDILCSVAIYCQRCGMIHLEDIPFFFGKEKLTLVCQNCESELAKLSVRPRKGLSIELSCGVCGGVNRIFYSLKKLKRTSFDKIFCAQDHFELGYIGRFLSIAEFLDYNKAEYEAVYPGGTEESVGRLQVLLEAVNRVHELAEAGSLFCSCGSDNFSLEVAQDRLDLLCNHCGRMLSLPAERPEDLRRITNVLDGMFRFTTSVERR